MPYASPSDYRECRRLHRRYGSTYYFASRAFPADVRGRVDALYGFVRVPDEWVDNPGTMSLEERRNVLNDYRAQLKAGLEGTPPTHAVLRAFCDVVIETGMPLDEPMLFLDAMQQDLEVGMYSTYAELESYMRGSAAAVGVMMLYVLGVKMDDALVASAKALGDAMQLTNFLRDIGEDLRRGRIYLPLEDLEVFGISIPMLRDGVVSPEFINLMKFEAERARTLYATADPGIERLPLFARRAVKMARILYSRILDRIEENGYDVFQKRARTSQYEKILVAAQTLTDGKH